MQSNSITNC